jgi:hypothetical protein
LLLQAYTGGWGKAKLSWVLANNCPISGVFHQIGNPRGGRACVRSEIGFQRPELSTYVVPEIPELRWRPFRLNLHCTNILSERDGYCVGFGPKRLVPVPQPRAARLETGGAGQESDRKKKERRGRFTYHDLRTNGISIWLASTSCKIADG